VTDVSIEEPTGSSDGDPMYMFGSVGNVLRILTLMRTEESVRVASVARELGIAGSTAHRLLAMLQHHRFVVQDRQSKAYSPGPALVDIGLSVASGPDLRGVAHPYLEAVRDATGETCGLSVLEGTDSVLLDVFDGTQKLRVVEHVGRREAAHLTSAGKALLAELTVADIRRLYPENDLHSPTGCSLTTRSELEGLLDDIRVRGFAVNAGESGEGTAGVGAAIRHRNGKIVGAVSIVFPHSRLNRDTESAMGEAVRTAAGSIGNALP